MLESMQSLFHSLIIDTTSEYRVATFSLSQSRTGVWGWSPSRRRPGYHPWKLLEFYMWFGAFWYHAIWWQLSVGRRTRYICNLAIKTEQICQLQCPRDSTVVLLLLSNEHALKSGIFGVPGLVLLGLRTAWHNPGHPGKSGMGGNPIWISWFYFCHFLWRNVFSAVCFFVHLSTEYM